MSRPHFNRSQSNVESWLDSHYEYMAPEQAQQIPTLNDDKGTKSYPYSPRPITPEPSENSSRNSRDKTRRHKPNSHHHTSSRPITPPSDDGLHRDRGREQRHGHHRSSRHSSRDVGEDREKRRSHRDEEKTQARYPPRADRGRPTRPPLHSVNTTPNFRDEEANKPRHHGRRYSVSHSPPRHRGERGVGGAEDHSKDREQRRRDRDARSHHSGGSTTASSSKDKTPRRPSLSHSKTSPAVPTKARRSSFAFLSDPRFTAAAEAALQAGATAAVGAMGSPGAGVKVARAALGAAAMGALRSGGSKDGKDGRVEGVNRKESTRGRRH